MNSIFVVIMFVILIIMFSNSTKKLRAVKKDGRYVDCYLKVLRDEEGSHENLNNYINEETNPELVNKSLIVKIYTDMLDQQNVLETIDRINFDEVLGVDATSKVTRNSDSFVWLILDLAKAKELGNEGLMDTLFEKVSQYAMDNQVEYLVFKAAYEIFSNKEDRDTSFLNKFLQGEYAGYAYDKQLVGFFKKFAATLLVYNNEEIDESDEAMLKDFALTQIGNRLMKSLNLLDKYLVKEDKEEANQVEETKEEEVPQIEVETKEEENKTE